MRKLVFLWSFIIVSLNFLSSCGDKDENNTIDDSNETKELTISFESTGITEDTDIEVGEKFTVEVSVKKDGNHTDLSTLEILMNGNNLSKEKIWTTDNNNISDNPLPLESEGNLVFMIDTEGKVGTSNSYQFVLTDANGAKDEVSFVITEIAADTLLDDEFSGIFYHIWGPYEGAYNLVDDKTMWAGDDDSKKDMLNIEEESFDGSWDTGAGNTTLFVKADNAFDYENISKNDAITAFNSGTSSSSITKPLEGDIYIAKLRGEDEYAVIKITSINAFYCPTCNYPGQISFDYKK